MEVRLKIGRYAGEVRDVRPSSAREMIADGRATDPRFEGEVPVPAALESTELNLQPVVKHKRGKR